jgi:hypothetical protein
MTWPLGGRAATAIRLDEGYTDLDLADMAKEMTMALAGFVNRNDKTLTDGTITIWAEMDPFLGPDSWLRATWEPNE